MPPVETEILQNYKTKSTSSFPKRLSYHKKHAFLKLKPSGGTSANRVSPMDYKEMRQRLTSFFDYPPNGTKPAGLAEAGFYYPNATDKNETRCFQCNISINDWKLTDKPWEKHARLSPNCPHVLTQITKNKKILHTDSSKTDRTMLEKRIDNNPFPTPNKTELEGQVKSGKSVLDGPSIRPLGSYSEYKNRIASYIRWPNTHISPETLAKAGFYCIGYNDVVRCAFCGIEGHNWEEGDNPMADHRKWNPSCSFVQRSEHDNTVAVLNSDTCGKYGIEIFPNSVPEEDELKQLEKLGIAKTKGPANPEYRAIETRIISFDTWPKCMKQRPAELAEAGFYYTGVGDQTLCFHCGGGLKNWEENDDPWEQHAMWFSKCNYLMLKKGIEYIEQIKRKNQAIVQEASGSAASSASHVETKEEASSALGAVVKAAEITSSEEVKTEEKTLCKICYKNELGVVFLPCGHIVACVDCASALKICAVCRKPLEATVRAFLS